MEPSFIGLAVFAVLSLLGWRLGSAPLFGLMLSLPFGSTAFVVLPMLGGATPQVYVLFAILLVASTLLCRGAVDALGTVFARQRSAWVVLFLMLLAFAGTILFPRLFAGDTVVMRSLPRAYVESPLEPSSKNVTQGGYFLLGTLVYFATSVFLVERARRALIVRAFFGWSIVHTTFGLIDLFAKYGGWGDVFGPIRTANYVTLSGQVAAGFPRLTGALPEASTFAAMTLACLAFSFAHWRGTGSRLALALVLGNLVLVVLCTSSTAYVAFPILCLPIAWQIGGSLLRGRLSAADRQILIFALSAVAIFLAMLLLNGDAMRSYFHLIDTRVFEKLGSPGGIERSYFNRLSLRNFLDTNGLGIGLGSSRSSSWPIAVLAQLGLAGAILMAVLVAILFRGMSGIPRTPGNARLIAAGNSVCASAVGGMVAASLSGASADPGVAFFLAVAVVASWRRYARDADAAAGAEPAHPAASARAAVSRVAI